MRGRASCRVHASWHAHRDPELGPRRVGAPAANLNALQHGHFSAPLSPLDLEALVTAIVERPDDLPLHVGRTVQYLQARTDDAFLAVIALHRLLVRLRPALAARFLDLEWRAWREALPAPVAQAIEDIMSRSASRTSPEERLRVLRQARKKRQRNN